jgi:hypothetical protein
MISAIISLVLGGLSLISAVPVVFPVFGLALGANALLKEKKKTDKKRYIMVLAIIGLLINGFITLMFVLGGFLRH